MQYFVYRDSIIEYPAQTYQYFEIMTSFIFLKLISILKSCNTSFISIGAGAGGVGIEL